MSDLLRVAQKIDLPMDTTKLLEAMGVIFALHIKMFKLFLQLSPFYEVWWTIASTVYGWIRELWTTLVQGADKPPNVEPPDL